MAQKQLIRDEITLIITFVLSILLLLSNFDLSGKVGQAINQVNFGLFPYRLLNDYSFCLVVFLVANRGNKSPILRLLVYSINLQSSFLDTVNICGPRPRNSSKLL